MKKINSKKLSVLLLVSTIGLIQPAVYAGGLAKAFWTVSTVASGVGTGGALITTVVSAAAAVAGDEGMKAAQQVQKDGDRTSNAAIAGSGLAAGLAAGILKGLGLIGVAGGMAATVIGGSWFGVSMWQMIKSFKESN